MDTKTNDIANLLNLVIALFLHLRKGFFFEKTSCSSLAQLFEMASVHNLGFHVHASRKTRGE